MKKNLIIVSLFLLSILLTGCFENDLPLEEECILWENCLTWTITNTESEENNEETILVWCESQDNWTCTTNFNLEWATWSIIVTAKWEWKTLSEEDIQKGKSLLTDENQIGRTSVLDLSKVKKLTNEQLEILKEIENEIQIIYPTK